MPRSEVAYMMDAEYDIAYIALPVLRILGVLMRCLAVQRILQLIAELSRPVWMF